MLILIGVWVAVGGSVAVLAGLSGLHQARRLRRDGISTWATTVPSPLEPDQQPGLSARRTLIQYALADGQVMERTAPQPARRAKTLRPGQKVLVWYDPEDPGDVLVYGREGRLADRGFVLAGALFVLLGAGIATFIR